MEELLYALFAIFTLVSLVLMVMFPRFGACLILTGILVLLLGPWGAVGGLIVFAIVAYCLRPRYHDQEISGRPVRGIDL